MNAWGDVLAGDTVRGADQRAWTVSGRHVAGTWVGSGRTDLHLDLRLGDRRRTVRRPSVGPVDLAGRGDHRGLAAAWSALAEGGFIPTILEDTIVTTAPADPFTAPAGPAGAVKRDRFGRYLLPDPATGKERAWTRATTVARALADEYHLTKWKMRQVAKGMALRPDLVAGAAAADPDADKSTLDDIADKAMERAGGSSGSTLGTALHNFTARLDRGEPPATLAVPEALQGDLAAYDITLKAHRLTVRPDRVERVVIVPDLGVVGTLDRIVGQPTGVTKSKPLSILDLKTAKSIDFSLLEISIQLAIYAHAPLMWNPATQAYEPMPEVDQERALVLHLPVGRAHGQVYGVNLIEGWECAQLAVRVREARSRSKGMAWLVDPDPADLALYRVARATDRAALARLWDQLHPQGLWTEEVNAAAANRLRELEPVSA